MADPMIADPMFADYQVLTDQPVTLDAATAQREVEFEVALAGLRLGTRNPQCRPLLGFHVRVHKPSSLKVYVQSQQILAWTLGVDTQPRGLWQPWSARQIQRPWLAGEVPWQGPAVAVPTEPGNQIRVRFLVSPTGRMEIENVVMWFHASRAI